MKRTFTKRMSIQLFKFDDTQLRSMTIGGLVYSAAKAFGDALEYADIPSAIKAHVTACLLYPS